MHTICSRLLRFLLLYFGLLAVALPSGMAQEPSPENAPASEQQTAPEPSAELQSPQATLRTFLRTMKEGDTQGALQCLDLSYLTSNVAEVSGPSIAHQVRTAVDRLVGISIDSPEDVWAAVPTDTRYAEPFTLNQIPDARPEARAIEIVRGDDGNWRFSEATCLAAEQYYQQVEQLPTMTDPSARQGEMESVPLPLRVRQWFPEYLRQSHFILPDYQWLCLLAVIFLGLVADLVVRNVATWVADFWIARSEEVEIAETTQKVWRPLGRLANVSIWYLGTKLIDLPSVALNVLLTVLQLFTIVAAVWTAFAVIDLFGKKWEIKAKKTATRFDDLLVPLVSKTLKLFAVCMGLLTAAQAYDLPILGLMGGLGLGGAALALASKDAVANFFGSVTVLFDRPFEVGDWIVTEGVEGSVEGVGFRSTRIRTFYNSQITLPNSLLTTQVVDNMGRRRYRRIKTTIGVQYDTAPEQIEAFCEGIRELIRLHPYTRKDYYHVYFNEFGASSLNILLYCFVACPDWSIELRERQRLLIDIMRLAKKLGVQFAFPTRTLHMFTGEPNGEAHELAEPTEQGKQLASEIAGAPPEKIPGPVQF